MPTFDPYHMWLGIRPEEQPANYYRLLGITPFEDNADAIACAADQRMGHVRSFQTGSHGALSQKILNELAAARICLLNAQKKVEYDRILQAALTPPSPPPSMRSTEAPPGVEMDFAPAVRKRHKKQKPTWMPWAAAGVGGLVVVVLFGMIARQDEPDIPALVASTPPRPASPGDPSKKVTLPVGLSESKQEPPQKHKPIVRKDTAPLLPIEPPKVDEAPPPEKPAEPDARIPNDDVAKRSEDDALELELLKKVAKGARTPNQHKSVAERANQLANEADAGNNVAVANHLKQLALAEAAKAKPIKNGGRDVPRKPPDTDHGNVADDKTPAADAIKKGVEWLISQQQSDGHWTFTANPNPGNLANSPCCATAMALIPLLRAGNSHREGEHREAVCKGLKYLTDSMIVNKNVGKLFEPGSRMYGQAICTIALCEAFARAKDRRLRESAQAAVNFIVYAQDPKGGGWRYEPQQGGDTSVTGWQITALIIAKTAKLQIPPFTLPKADNFLNTVQMGGGASYNYEPGNAAGPANTPVGLLCRIHLGYKKDHPALQRGIVQVSDQGPSPDNMYFNYYGTQLMRNAPSDRWLKWRSKICDQLVAAQSTQEDSKGSWHYGGMGSAEGGRLYSTSMAVMTLQFCELIDVPPRRPKKG